MLLCPLPQLDWSHEKKLSPSWPEFGVKVTVFAGPPAVRACAEIPSEGMPLNPCAIVPGGSPSRIWSWYVCPTFATSVEPLAPAPVKFHSNWVASRLTTTTAGAVGVGVGVGVALGGGGVGVLVGPLGVFVTVAVGGWKPGGAATSGEPMMRIKSPEVLSASAAYVNKGFWESLLSTVAYPSTRVRFPNHTEL